MNPPIWISNVWDSYILFLFLFILYLVIFKIYTFEIVVLDKADIIINIFITYERVYPIDVITIKIFDLGN